MKRTILAIETSCDETAMALLRGDELLANIVSTQIKDHSGHGGVIPELASRLHLANIDIVFNELLKESKIDISTIDAIAIVNGPGLIGSLHVGVIFARSLSYLYNIPIHPVHHIAGHIYANSLITKLEFPLLALVVSGGHTQLVLMKEHLDFEILGETLDDAVGESYDKVARLLKIGYPGGPIIDKLAQDGELAFNFPTPLDDSTYNFSYSGLKSAVINKVNQLSMKNEAFKHEDLAYSFQVKAIDILVKKSVKACLEYNVKHFVLAGGVSANSYLRRSVTETFTKQLPNVRFTLPPLWCCTDNAAMIAACASYIDPTLYKVNYDIKVNPNAKLETVK